MCCKRGLVKKTKAHVIITDSSHRFFVIRFFSLCFHFSSSAGAAVRRGRDLQPGQVPQPLPCRWGFACWCEPEALQTSLARNVPHLYQLLQWGHWSYLPSLSAHYLAGEGLSRHNRAQSQTQGRVPASAGRVRASTTGCGASSQMNWGPRTEHLSDGWGKPQNILY